jgi:hypothetical protein
VKEFRPAGETLRQFMLSKAPVKLIQGPIGCLSEDTEFLTPSGWKFISCYRPGDQVAEWDPATGEIAFRAPRAFIDKPCEEMWAFRNEHSLSMVVSDEHRVPLYDYSGKFVVRTAAQLARCPSRHTVPVSFLAPAGGGLPMTEQQIRLWVAISADGCLPKRGNQVVVTVRKERKKQRLRELLAANKVEWAEYEHSKRPGELSFAFPRTGWGKGFGPEWWTASRRQLEVVLDECIFWDGLANHAEQRFYTTHRSSADFIQYAAHATGRRATISAHKDPRGDWNFIYTVFITTPGSSKAKVMLRGDCVRIERVAAPGGRKYCFETSTGFFVARHADRVFVTGNSGKSLACVMSIWMKALEQAKQADGKRRCRVHVFRDTYGKLEDTTIKTWLDWFPEKDFGHFYWSKPFVHEIRVGDIELDVHFIALEDERAAGYFRSLETTMCWFNEVQYIQRILFDEAVSRVGRYPRAVDGGAVNPCVIADMNAPDESHWIPIMRGDVAPPDWWTEEQRKANVKPAAWEFFVQPPGLLEHKDSDGEVSSYSENPLAENLAYLPRPGGRNYYLHAIDGKTKSWIDANVLNRVSARKDGKPVLPDFNRAVHVAKKDIEAVPGLPLIIGCDFARKPAAIIQQHIRGKWQAIDELIGRDMGADKFAPLLKKLLAQNYPGFPYKMFGDPSGDFKGQNDDNTPFQIFRKHGLQILPAPSILLTVRLQAAEAVLTRMAEGRPSFSISPKCSVLIAALDGGYHYRRLKVAGERYKEEPEKDEYSDPADAWMYGLLGGGEGRVLLTGSSEPKAATNTRRPYNPFDRPKGKLRQW